MSDEQGFAGHDDVLELISAVARGDATREDVAQTLRASGVDALDVLIEVLARSTRKRARADHFSQPLDIQRPSSPTAPRTSAAPHHVPLLPFLLHGTLYDPADIVRFNGQELHTVVIAGRDHLLVIDDRAVIEQWWQMSQISSARLLVSDQKTVGEYTDTGSAISTRGPIGEGSSSPGGGFVGGGASPASRSGITDTEGPASVYGPTGSARAIFYEDDGYGGSYIEVPPNRGYADLTQVAYTFLGTGDWNDTISSVQTVTPLHCALYEDVDFGGSTITLFGWAMSLRPYGWNDRASSVAAW